MPSLRVANIIEESFVDGPGIRLAIFVQGCHRRCTGCQNPTAQDFAGGKLIDTSEIISMLKRNPLIDGVTLSGGEPFEQPYALADLCDEVHKLGYNIMAWSGYTFEQLAADKGKRKLLERIDVLVDGEFKEELKSLDLLWLGSKNQRIIDVKNSIRENLIVEVKA